VRFPSINAWWAQVTVTPELSKTAVLRRGTAKAFKGCTPTGGHVTPNSTVGAKLLWKKAQKNARKKNTSEIINSTIPRRRPANT